MSLHLITGYAGMAHVTSANQGAFNAIVVGTGDYVVNTGNKLLAQVISNNQIRILDGEVFMQGRHINIEKNTYEEVGIANGLSGMKRNDLIVLRYTKDANTGVENVALVVLQGVSTEGTAVDPSYTTGDILGGECLLHEMPLYRVPLEGLNVGELVPLFEVKDSIPDHDAEVDSKLVELNASLIEMSKTEIGTPVGLTANSDFICPSDGYFTIFLNNADTGCGVGYVNGKLILSLNSTKQTASATQAISVFVRKGMVLKHVVTDGNLSGVFYPII